MMPLCSSNSLQLALTATVYILFGLSTCSTKECGLHITQKMKDRSGTLRNIDNMLCQVYCQDDLIFVSCRKSKKMKKTGGSSVPPQNHPHDLAKPSASKVCDPKSRCLESGSGKAVGVQATPSPTQCIFLHMVSKRGDMENLKKLLSEGKEDINCRGEKAQMTPLMKATMGKHLSIVRFLVKKNADVLLVNKHGENALLLSCRVGAVEITKFYLSLNVFDINCRGRWTSTPLMRAAQHKQTEMVKFLVSKGADLSLLDDNGNNVLHNACRSGNLETIKYLLSLNVLNLNAKNWSGRTALKFAKFRKKQELVDFLKSQGA